MKFETILGNGNVGIGTTSPADKLTVVGDVNVSGCFQLSNGTIIGGSCVSGREYKMNEQNITIDWDKFNSVSSKSWDWKDKNIIVGNNTIDVDTKGRGFIYEDVVINYPERVSIVDGVKRVLYGFDWVFDNRNAIQELKRENELLKDRLDLIESMLNITQESEPYIPEELGLYECAVTLERRECPGGLSGVNKDGYQTRCYNTLKLGWKTCQGSGWDAI